MSPLLQTSTAEGALKGMVTARAPHELQDQEVAYLQDAIINQPGFVNRRGAITGTTAITAANLDSQRPAAVGLITDPQGVPKVGIFYLKDTGTVYELWVSVYTVAAGVFTFVQKHNLCPSVTGTTYPVRNMKVQAVPAIDGSVLISLRQSYGRNISAGATVLACGRVVRWYGGCPTTSIAAGAVPTATVVATEGSTSVTGAVGEIAKISFPGVVIANTGVVASVTSTTAVELVYPSPKTYGATATGYFVGEQLPVARARGKVSCSAGVLTGATGYGTKFTEANDTATLALFDATKAGYTITDLTTMQLLMTQNAGGTSLAVSDTLTGLPTAVARSASLKNYLLYAIKEFNFSRFNPVVMVSTIITPRSVRGSFWTTFKGYMLSFNGLVEQASGNNSGDTATTARFYVHGPRFPDIMDHSVSDGDWGEAQATKQGDSDGIACQGGSNAVVLCKGQETFALRGNSPDDFYVDKVADDGALTFESITSWQGRPIWLGKTGIWMYDGNDDAAINITEATLGVRWKELVASFDGSSNSVDSDNYMLNQARCFVYKDYLFVNITNTGSQHVVYTDGVARTSNPVQMMIYLPTMAVSFLSNFNFQCFVQIGRQGYVILPQDASTTHHWFTLDNLFVQGVATDTIVTANCSIAGPSAPGPWFHMESRRLDIGDGLLKKNWKQLAVESKLTSAKQMFLETVAGLNTTGVRAVLPFIGTGSYKAARVKFRTRDQYMGFRLYEDISNRPATLSLGAWQWAFKPARRGAV